MASVIPPLIVVVGETASGKTALGIKLAEKFNGEIICADSRTIYRGMDIGTAKPTKDERARVPHHLLDIRNPDETYSAAQFQKDAQKLIQEISDRGKLPIMVGGSGLYIDSVIYNYSFQGDGQRDPINPRHSGEESQPKDRQLRGNTLVLGVQTEKEQLAQRIESRVQSMLGDGLLDEVQGLVDQFGRENEALRGSGYYYLADYLAGRTDQTNAVQEFTRSHMLLAKKQRTWFKRNKSIHWLTDPSKAVDITTTLLSNLSV